MIWCIIAACAAVHGVYLICFLSALNLLCHGEDCGVYIRESQFSKKRKEALNGETPEYKSSPIICHCTGIGGGSGAVLWSGADGSPRRLCGGSCHHCHTPVGPESQAEGEHPAMHAYGFM